MPPIPVYSDAPIVAAKADGVTPQSANQPTPTQNEQSTANNSTSAYPAARPGAPAVPAPTSSVPKPAPPPTRTLQQAAQDHRPPVPQPGAVPIPPIQAASTSGLPPPPTTSEPLHQPPTTMPPQYSIPPPSLSSAPNSSTLPNASTQQRTGPTTLPLGDVPQIPPAQSQYSTHEKQPRSSSEQATGYRQNPFAAEMSATQRASLEASEAEDRRSSLGFLSSVTGGASGAGAGFGAGEGGGVWDSVKALASTAGKKAVELEEEVWKRVNGH